MSDTDPKDSQSNNALSTRKFVGLVCAMCIGFGLLGGGLGTLGDELAGDPGKWSGMVAAFLILCMVCWFVYSRFTHPQLALACCFFVILGASKVGEEIGRDIGGEFATRWSGSIAMALGFILCFVCGGLADRRASDTD